MKGIILITGFAAAVAGLYAYLSDDEIDDAIRVLGPEICGYQETCMDQLAARKDQFEKCSERVALAYFADIGEAADSDTSMKQYEREMERAAQNYIITLPKKIKSCLYEDYDFPFER